MNTINAMDNIARKTDPIGPYTIYTAGGLFTQDELATNTMLKEAVWRLSNGKFQLFLPQFREVQELDQPNIKAYIRNTDLIEVVKADILLARFEGAELDPGTVVEFMVAKNLGKPAVILRSDFRRMYCTGLPDPINLMALNWPRTIEVLLDSFKIWAEIYTKELNDAVESEIPENAMKVELDTIQKSCDAIAREVIAALETVIKMESPYPPKFRENAYQAMRFSPGHGFDELLTVEQLEIILERLKTNGTL